jgi:hypothetical protein
MKKYLFAIQIIFSFTVSAQKSPCNPLGLPYTTVPGDTTITLPHGTQLTFNRCEYFDIRECLELIEAYDITSIREQNLTTLDRNGNALLSAGMFCIRMTGDCASRPCFEVPVKIRMPLPGSSSNSCGKCETGTFRLYNSSDGFWSDSSNNKFKIIDSAGRSWIEFKAYCGNICYNADCKLKTGKTKIKVKGMARLDTVEISMQCPVGVLKFTPKKGGKKVIVNLPCYETGAARILAKGYDASGSPVYFPESPVKDMKHSHGMRKCKSKEMGKKTRSGSFYKKYILFP